MVGVARKTDEDDQVIVAAVIQFAVSGPLDGLDILLELLTALVVFFSRNLDVGLQTYRSRVNAADVVGRSHHLAMAVVHGIAVVTVVAFDDSEAMGVVQVVVEFVTRGETVDDLSIRLREAYFHVLQRSRKDCCYHSEKECDN